MDGIFTTPVPVTHDLLRTIGKIDEAKGAWRAIGAWPSERLEALRSLALCEAVAASTRLEGVLLSARDVARLLPRLPLKSFAGADEQAAAGYADALQWILTDPAAVAITGYHLKELHRRLHGFVTKDGWHRGKYKISGRQHTAFERDGLDLDIRFDAASAVEAPRLMTQLFAWMAREREQPTLHPLVRIALFTIVFLDIAPFQDGNARMSRLLATLLLLQSGYEHAAYAPLEAVFETRREAYYRAREITQRSLRDGHPDFEPWLHFFMDALAEQALRAAAKMTREREVATKLPALATQLLDHVESHGRLTMQGALRLTRANRNTLKLQLRRLVAGGHLLLHGGGRSAWYALP
jgi:Fic family protein